MSEIPKLYDPQEAQAKWFPYWEQRGDFNADPDPAKPSHTIMIPLPNVTGALHMGHALNGTCQDLITRWRRMQGYEALWMPGTDHAGIATQAVVERRMLEEEGLTRHDLGKTTEEARKVLVNRIERWKDVYEKRIISQQKKLGASCDWRRVRFTLDEVCAKAVRRTFFKMFSDGLIFRGKRLVNWDVHLQTAVADDEVFEEDTAGHFWTFNYPVVDEAGNPTGEAIRFSTTRPETMLGDTAVCVHPTDERYTHLVGKHVKLPFANPETRDVNIPIIADALLADKEKGTGAVKVTPAHDPNDYACYMRNPEIGVINILNADGTINEYGRVDGADWQGIDRLEVRQHIIQRMTELGHFESVEDRVIPLKHSDRSKTPVEPFLSDQWFVKMGPHTKPDGEHVDLAQSAMDAVEKNDIRFYPSRYAKTYTDWLSEKRDWCISRQLWWGHRIPIWSTAVRDVSDGEIVKKQIESRNWFNPDKVYVWIQADGKAAPSTKAKVTTMTPNTFVHICVDDNGLNLEQSVTGEGFVQDPDVLDTWFSSALWPHATLGWPDTEHNPPMMLQDVGPFKLDSLSIPKWLFDLVPESIARENTIFPIGVKDQKLLIACAEKIEGSDGSDLTAAAELEAKLEFILERKIELLTSDPNEITVCIDRNVEKFGATQTDLEFSSPLGDIARNEVLPYFYPHDTYQGQPHDNKSVLITSRDIITLWVARMVLTGLYNMDGKVPFRHVHVHPKILDGFGQTMSKSKGNGVDPVDLIHKYGADAIRFTISSFAGETQDVRLPISYECPHCEEMVPPKQYKLDNATVVVPSTLKGEFPVPQGAPKPVLVCPNKKCKQESQFTTPLYDPDPDAPLAKMVSERFEYGRNFCNKFWNAARFAMLNLEGYTPDEVTADQLQLEDQWILSRLSTVAHQIDEYLGRYQFDAATRAIRDFTWNEFCDWYLEMIKPRLRGEIEERAIAQRVLLAVLDSLVRLLQPFTPFICEELWSRLNEIAPERALPIGPNRLNDESSRCSILVSRSCADACINAEWPALPATWQDTALEQRFSRLQETIVAIRNVRAIYNIPPGTSVKLLMRATPEVATDMQSVASQFDNLTKAVLEAAGADVERPAGSASFSLGETDGYIPLEGLINTAEELERQKKKLAEVEKHLKGTQAKLNNEKFVSSAPEEVVNGVKESLANLESQRASIQEIIDDLS